MRWTTAIALMAAMVLCFGASCGDRISGSDDGAISAQDAGFEQGGHDPDAGVIDVGGAGDAGFEQGDHDPDAGVIDVGGAGDAGSSTETDGALGEDSGSSDANVAYCTGDAGSSTDTLCAFTERLTRGSWTKTLGEGAYAERYTYTFARDGQYTLNFCSDYFTTSKGGWSLVEQPQGTVHLLLQVPDAGQCYWLGCDSVIAFDDNKDLLVVSGPNVVGKQYLTHDSCVH